jgi:preprotein translocase subunit SecE
MSAEDTLSEKRRRRALRRQAEAEVSDNVDEIEEVEGEVAEEEEVDSSGRGLTERKGRPTPSRRTQEIEVAETRGNFITRYFYGLVEYFAGVRSELQKVVWPTREETRRLTTIVLIVTIAASITLGIISLIFNALIAAGLNAPTIVFGGLFLIALVVFVWYLRQSNRRTSSF